METKELQVFKYQALGNDYLLCDPQFTADLPEPEMIQKICSRHYGLGGDGLLWGPLPSQSADTALRIFNPDGSEAEKSGNGLRIFARYCIDADYFQEDQTFRIETSGGIVRACVFSNSHESDIAMGKVTFDSQKIPAGGPSRELIEDSLIIGEKTFIITALSIGNPHCVIESEHLDEAYIREWGPKIEHHSLFPKRINVQFMKILNPHLVQIGIWERGAGYTLASGSSATAASAAAVRLGKCRFPVTVELPGGKLFISQDKDGTLRLRGEAKRVFAGKIRFF
jgi:diaminopimelate epimerase